MKKTMFLHELENDLIKELEDRKEEILEDEYPEDYIREIIDSAIPIYTSDLLDCAKDTLELAVDEPEIMAFDGKNTAANAIAGNIYELLSEKANEWLNEQDKKKEEINEIMEENTTGEKKLEKLANV